TAQAATYPHREPNTLARTFDRLQADIVNTHRGTVVGRSTDRNLELARQKGKLRMQGGPLTDNLAPHQWIDHLVRRYAGEMVGGGVAYAVAASLDRMQLRLGEFGQNIRYIFQLGPVELHVLPCCEMA